MKWIIIVMLAFTFAAFGQSREPMSVDELFGSNTSTKVVVSLGKRTQEDAATGLNPVTYGDKASVTTKPSRERNQQMLEEFQARKAAKERARIRAWNALPEEEQDRQITEYQEDQRLAAERNRQREEALAAFVEKERERRVAAERARIKREGAEARYQLERAAKGEERRFQLNLIYEQERIRDNNNRQLINDINRAKRNAYRRAVGPQVYTTSTSWR